MAAHLGGASAEPPDAGCDSAGESEEGAEEPLSWLDATQFADAEQYEGIDCILDPGELIRRIEGHTEAVLRALVGGGPVCLDAVSRQAGNAGSGAAGSVRLRSGVTRRSALSAATASSFAKLFRVLAFVHSLVRGGKMATQREIYYCLIQHFAHQRELNSTILEAVGLLRCSRFAMNVTASGRGFVAGNMQWNETGEPGRWVDCSSVGIQGANIPGYFPPTLQLRSTARHIIVVEKDSVFQRLCEARVWLDLPCIVITACGYPDLNTRVLIWRLAEEFGLPVLGVVDYNPFGVSILMTYKYGSRSMGLEAYRYAIDLKWLGLHAADVTAHEGPALSARDRRLLSTLQSSSALRREAQWARELGLMRAANRKVELQAVCAPAGPDHPEGGVQRAAAYIKSKVLARQYI
eukprot:TRINITY_DN34986_c0_g1_i2.p2 TRINITY_DN34986_c0_g1~~TRINITY_DN34986_c0_g1_i2.p2  ORF type:complete len:437 (+),score=146.36 TRINITY_DN34986_c0_g1_i2:93-1313(+)